MLLFKFGCLSANFVVFWQLLYEVAWTRLMLKEFFTSILTFRISFTVVSEPLDDDSWDAKCEDIQKM